MFSFNDNDVVPTGRLTPKTSSHGPRGPPSTSDTDAELDIIDYDVLEAQLKLKPRAPRILPGARGAQQLPGSSKVRSAHARDYIPPSAQDRRRGGNQNDSRRRYLALNSLRRKAYKLSLATQEAGVPGRPQSAELMSYHSRGMSATLSRV